MGITHAKVSTKTNGTDSSLVQASDWNSAHSYTSDLFGSVGASASVVSNTASAMTKAFASFLQGLGYTIYVCDGVSDDTEIQAAIDALPSGGGRVLLSEGTFLISDSIAPSKDYVEICGQGPSTIIKLADGVIPNATGRLTYIGSACPVIYSGHPDDPTFYDHITIRNLQIDGNTANQGAPVTDYDKWYNIGIFMLGCDYWTLENIEVKNCGSGGIYSQGGAAPNHTYGHKFSNVSCYNNGKNGVTTWEERGGIHLEYTDKTQYSNVVCYDNQGCGLAATYSDVLTGAVMAYGNGLGGVAAQGYGVYLDHDYYTDLVIVALENALAGVRIGTCYYGSINIMSISNTQEGAIVTGTGFNLSGFSYSNGYNGLTVQAGSHHQVKWVSVEDGRTGVQLNGTADCETQLHVYKAGWYGVQIYASTYCSVLNGGFVDNGQATTNTYADIGIEASSNHNQIIGNSCQATLTNKVAANIAESASDYNIIQSNDVSGGVTSLITRAGTHTIIKDNIGYIDHGEVRSLSGSLTAGIANAIGFSWHNPEAQDILIKKVVVEVTTGGGTVGSHLDVGIADDTAGTNRGTEFFNDLLLNSAQIDDSWVAGDGGTQTKWVLCQDSASATDGWLVGQILDANAASLVGKYYIEYIGR